MNNTTEGYQSPSRFDAAEKPHAFQFRIDAERGDNSPPCAICGFTPSALIHRVLTHNPEADEAERLRVRETFVLKDHMAGVGRKCPLSPGMDNTAPPQPVTVTLEQAIIIAKHYLLFDELEKRAVDAETRAVGAEARAVTAGAFAASALNEASVLREMVEKMRPVYDAAQENPNV